MTRRLLVAVVAAIAACSGTEDRGGQTGTAETSGSEQPQATQANMRGMSMGGDAPIRISARQAALAGVTFAVVREAPLVRTVRAVAMVVPNERGLGIVNARVDGWVEKLHVNETGRHVEVGEPLLDLYAPSLVTVQEEFLLAKRLVATAGGNALVMAARRRLRLWDISDEEINELERTGEVHRTLTIRSAFSGHVMEKHVIEGQMIHAGDRLFKLADLSTVWIEPALFERDMPFVRIGQRATITFGALPAAIFKGRVTFIHPTLDMQTRTLRVRIEVPNAGIDIKPMMYGTVRIRSDGPRGTVVPLSAVLPTGDRDLAFVIRENGIVPTPVVAGARGDSTILVLDGLVPGDTVVASATFLLDSESSLAAAMAGIMLNMGMGLDMGGMEMDMPDSTMPNIKMDGGR